MFLNFEFLNHLDFDLIIKAWRINYNEFLQLKKRVTLFSE